MLAKADRSWHSPGQPDVVLAAGELLGRHANAVPAKLLGAPQQVEPCETERRAKTLHGGPFLAEGERGCKKVRASVQRPSR
jgi:hypothetical protein